MSPVKEPLTRPTPRRAVCANGHALDVRADRPSFWHRDPERPCYLAVAQDALAAPRRAL